MFGFGKSLLKNPISLHDYALGIIKIIEENNFTDVTLIGHSFGGKVALEVALNYKEIKSLILIDVSGVKPRFSLKKYLSIKLYKLSKKMNLNTDKFGSYDYKNAKGYLRETFLNVVNTHLEKIDQINCLTLILWGRRDKETPFYMAKKINKKIKNSTIIKLNGGHFAYTEDKAFIYIVKAYLKGVYDN